MTAEEPHGAFWGDEGVLRLDSECGCTAQLCAFIKAYQTEQAKG